MISRGELHREITGCTACDLHRGCTGPVSFTGRVTARAAVVGEAPGRIEDSKRKPFVGPTGRFLWTELSRFGLRRRELFVCNAVSCYPHGAPPPESIEACHDNLMAQLSEADVSNVLVLGNVALHSLLPDAERVSVLHGQPQPFLWMTLWPVFHPAAVLRNRTKAPVFRKDLKRFVAAVGTKQRVAV